MAVARTRPVPHFLFIHCVMVIARATVPASVLSIACISGGSFNSARGPATRISQISTSATSWPGGRLILAGERLVRQPHFAS